ncbi:MAG: hypothetical protein ACYCS1_02315 [Gammaproteobacteria bacterium]
MAGIPIIGSMAPNWMGMLVTSLADPLKGQVVFGYALEEGCVHSDIRYVTSKCWYGGRIVPS